MPPAKAQAMATPIRHRGKWRIRWIDENHARRSEVFDDYKTAAHVLKQREVTAEERRKGILPKAPVEHTFEELCTVWTENRGARKRSAKNDESICRKLREFFGDDRPIRQIGVGDEDEYCDEHDDLSPKTLANHITLLITMMNYVASFREPWIDRVPKLKKPKIDALARNYSYLRNEEEIRRFLDAARDEGEMVYMLYLVAVRTGMRAGELAGLEWGDVDLEGRLIMVQRSFNGPTKSLLARPVPILDVLLPELRAWRMRHPGRYVFTNRDGGMLARSGRIFQEVLHRVLDRAGFPHVEAEGRVRRYITFHGLRHTFASHWMMRGGEIYKLQKVLGHQSIAMTERYSHLAVDAFKNDYDRFGPARSLDEAKVLPIPRRTG
jgi:integrase